MIITLMSISMTIIGIILMVIKNSNKSKFSWETKETLEFIGAILIILGAVCSFFTGVFIIDNVTSYELDYQNALHEKEMLEYRIDHIENNITGNEMIYNDIVEFNNELRAVKKWANNPWTNWFNNKDIASLDYIEINRE